MILSKGFVILNAFSRVICAVDAAVLRPSVTGDATLTSDESADAVLRETQSETITLTRVDTTP